MAVAEGRRSESAFFSLISCRFVLHEVPQRRVPLKDFPDFYIALVPGCQSRVIPYNNIIQETRYARNHNIVLEYAHTGIAEVFFGATCISVLVFVCVCVCGL